MSESPTPAPPAQRQSVAILIANAHYQKEHDLDCCLNDLEAVKKLIEAAGKHSAIHAVSDVDADQMRETIRQAIDPDKSYSEVFFYFSGHGATVNGEFYYVGTSLNQIVLMQRGFPNLI